MSKHLLFLWIKLTGQLRRELNWASVDVLTSDERNHRKCGLTGGNCLNCLELELISLLKSSWITHMYLFCPVSFSMDLTASQRRACRSWCPLVISACSLCGNKWWQQGRENMMGVSESQMSCCNYTDIWEQHLCQWGHSFSPLHPPWVFLCQHVHHPLTHR